jgi:hypothetical protein
LEKNFSFATEDEGVEFFNKTFAHLPDIRGYFDSAARLNKRLAKAKA